MTKLPSVPLDKRNTARKRRRPEKRIEKTKVNRGSNSLPKLDTQLQKRNVENRSPNASPTSVISRHKAEVINSNILFDYKKALEKGHLTAKEEFAREMREIEELKLIILKRRHAQFLELLEKGNLAAKKIQGIWKNRQRKETYDDESETERTVSEENASSENYEMVPDQQTSNQHEFKVERLNLSKLSPCSSKTDDDEFNIPEKESKQHSYVLSTEFDNEKLPSENDQHNVLSIKPENEERANSKDLHSPDLAEDPSSNSKVTTCDFQELKDMNEESNPSHVEEPLISTTPLVETNDSLIEAKLQVPRPNGADGNSNTNTRRNSNIRRNPRENINRENNLDFQQSVSETFGFAENDIDSQKSTNPRENVNRENNLDFQQSVSETFGFAENDIDSQKSTNELAINFGFEIAEENQETYPDVSSMSSGSFEEYAPGSADTNSIKIQATGVPSQEDITENKAESLNEFPQNEQETETNEQKEITDFARSFQESFGGITNNDKATPVNNNVFGNDPDDLISENSSATSSSYADDFDESFDVTAKDKTKTEMNEDLHGFSKPASNLKKTESDSEDDGLDDIMALAEDIKKKSTASQQLTGVLGDPTPQEVVNTGSDNEANKKDSPPTEKKVEDDIFRRPNTNERAELIGESFESDFEDLEEEVLEM